MGVSADSERDLRWLGSLVPRPACAFGAKGPKGGYLSSSVLGSRWPFSIKGATKDQLAMIDSEIDSRIDGQPTAMRFDSHSCLCRAVPRIEGISVFRLSKNLVWLALAE